jgi:hypothetical protein
MREAVDWGGGSSAPVRGFLRGGVLPMACAMGYFPAPCRALQKQLSDGLRALEEEIC